MCWWTMAIPFSTWCYTAPNHTPCSGLGYHVVAEGIETQAAYDLLVEWGCDEGQDYLMSKPIPAADLRDRLAAALPWQQQFARHKVTS
jgi:predicted signal transduction protein with EAL and GGDEF domain